LALEEIWNGTLKTLSDIRIWLIKRFYFPLIFNCSDAMRTLGDIENHLFFARCCSHKI